MAKMQMNPAARMSGMGKDGQRVFEGLEEAVLRNIEAAKGISTMLHTSMGPNGMKKLVVNHLEKIFVTSDCATILRELEVQHPAANLLVGAAAMQDAEFGDCTNFTISLAGELLKLAGELLRDGLHQAEIVAGYTRAYEHCVAALPDLTVRTLSGMDDLRNEEKLVQAMRATLASKQYGYEDFLAGLVARACVTVMPNAAAGQRGGPNVNVESVRICKMKGGSLEQSSVVSGMIVLRDSEGVVSRVQNAKVAVYACGLEASSTEAKGTVLLRNADELMNYNKSEEKKMQEIVDSIAQAGVTVVVSNGSISNMAQHFLDRNNIMVIKINSKWELRRICRAVNATAMVRLGAPTPEEMGECSHVEVREFGGRKAIVLDQDAADDTRIATIVVRAATENMLNDVERALDDGINAIKTLCRDGRLLPGGGAVEMELAQRLRRYADEIGGVDQYAIRKFGEAFEVFPRVLAESAGHSPTDLITALYAAHANGEANVGLDIEDGRVADRTNDHIYDLLMPKTNALRLAVDAALTVLRVDQIVMSKQAGGPKPREQQAPDA